MTEKSIASGLSLRLAAGLLALAALALLNYGFLNYHTYIAREDAQIINLAGRQRLLASQIAAQASHLANYHDDVDTSATTRRKLRETMQTMRDEHDALCHGTLPFLREPVLQNLFFSPPHRLDERIEAFIHAALLLSIDGPGSTEEDSDYRYIIDQADSLVHDLDGATREYQQLAVRRIHLLEYAEFMALTVQLLALLALWLFAFRPLARRTTNTIRSLEDTRNQLMVSNRRLGEHATQLEFSRNTIETLHKRLEAIINAAGEGICGLDIYGSIIFANPAASRLLGRGDAELIGSNFCALVQRPATGSEVAEGQPCPLRAAIARGEDYHGTHELSGAGNNGPISLQFHGTPLRQEQRLTGSVVVFSDVTARNHAEQVIRRYVTSLEHSNQELDDFTYIASHDLKEPLRGIHSYAAFMLDDYGDRLESGGQEILRNIMRMVRRLGYQLDALMHYSRLGRAELQRTSVDLNQTLAEAIDSLRIAIMGGNAKIRVATPLPTVSGNQHMVRELLYNLLSNAIKYNDKNQKIIEVGWRQDGMNGICYVRDNGIGIPAEQQEMVFDIFRRLHGQDQYGGGMGAGLTIARKIVERHGGRIWVESQPGQGSTFYFTLGEGIGNDACTESGRNTSG